MRLLAIRGRNLASLGAAFEIDLEAAPLRSAGLFAISGPTGAGKSTLLDAICLALYDALPRLGNLERDAKIRDASGEELQLGDPRGALRHGAGSGYAEVDFVGQDGETYRARWSVRRAREKATGKPQAAQITLTRLSDGVAIATQKREALAEIAARVGLSFEQFTRSAMLAQGEFDAFLRAKANERALLLERITGSEIYARLSRAAHGRAAAERRALEALQARFEAHAPLGAPERAAAEARAAAADQTAATAAEAAGSLERARAWLEQADALALTAADLDAAAGAAARSARAEAEAAHSATLAKIAETEAARARLTERLEAQGDLRRLEPVWAETRAALDALDAARDRVETAAARRRAVGAALQAARARRDSADSARTAARAAATEAANQAEAAAAAWRDWNAEALEAERERLGALLAAAEQGAAAAQGAREAAEARGQAQTEAAAAASAATAAEAAGAEALSRRGPAQAAHAAAQRRLERWTAAAGDAAKALRAQLAPGAPCPVCGGVDHRSAPADATLQAALATERDEASTAEAALRAIETALAQAQARGETQRDRAKAAEIRAAAAERKLSEAAAARAAAAAALSARLGAAAPVELRASGGAPRGEDRSGFDFSEFGFSEFDFSGFASARRAELDGLAERLRGAQAARAAADAAGERARAATAERSAAEARFEAAAGALAQAERDADAAEADAQSAREALERLSDGLAARLDPIAPDWRARAAQEVSGRIDRALSQLAEDGRRLAETTARLPALAADLEVLAELRGADDGPTPAPSGDAAGEAPDRRRAMAARQAAVEARVRAEEAAERLTTHRAAAPEAAGLAPELFAAEADLGPAREALAPAIAQAAEGLRAAETERDAARAALAQDDAARTRQAQEQAALQARRAAAAPWLKLDALIGSADGSKFRRYAQTLTFARLIALANARLKELQPRYALAAAETGGLALQVIDLEMGGETRGAHNLSGGERFLVSLALALGLAALSGEGGVRVETLFIDEGFGALDPDSLGAAIAALEALQATGRRIGVISHVPEVGERIAAQVQVRPLGGGRSSVQVVSGGD